MAVRVKQKAPEKIELPPGVSLKLKDVKETVGNETVTYSDGAGLTAVFERRPTSFMLFGSVTLKNEKSELTMCYTPNSIGDRLWLDVESFSYKGLNFRLHEAGGAGQKNASVDVPPDPDGIKEMAKKLAENADDVVKVFKKENDLVRDALAKAYIKVFDVKLED